MFFKVNNIKQICDSNKGFETCIKWFLIFQLALSWYTFRAMQSAQWEFEIGIEIDKIMN